MRVMPEDVLYDLLSRCVGLSQEVLPALRELGTQPVKGSLAERYQALVSDLHRQKRHDSILNDETWEWIWHDQDSLNHFQLYGRLAWLNYSLFDLL